MTIQDLAKLTPEEKRIRIAELCPTVAFIKDDTFGKRAFWRLDVDEAFHRDFDPLNDLNAMHEAEKANFAALVEKKYWGQLVDVSQRDSLPPVGHWQLGAAQRADAFLLTLG